MSVDKQCALKVLIIDDDQQNLGLLADALDQPDVRLLCASGANDGILLFQKHRPDLVLVDLMMPEKSLDVLDEITALDPGTEVILMTGHYSPESAVAAIRRGAADYLTKPANITVLRERVTQMCDETLRRRRTLELDDELVSTFKFEDMVGRRPVMMDLFAKIRRIAPHFRTLLVTGATGTGKELVAQALHKLSSNNPRPFAMCNCAAIVDTLIETELFGHVRGAFTGAAQDKPGLFEFANGGTVFLDEIGDMPLQAQTKLL